MFNKIEIERFRGIKYASIEGFKQINLFFGKNNCGKSSLLESIFLASGLSNPLLPIHVNFMRGYGKSNFNDIILNCHNLDSSQPIIIQLIDGEVRNLNITLFKENQENITLNTDSANILSNVEEGKYGLKLDSQIKSLMGQVMVAVENYPQLKSDQTMMTAMQTYNEVEEHISAARRFYNSAVLELNNAVEIFPSSAVAAIIGVRKQAFFQAENFERQPINASDYLN